MATSSVASWSRPAISSSSGTDEPAEKFRLDFAILTRDRIEASRSGNPFDEAGSWIARLDMLSRNEDLNLQRAHLMVNYDLPWNPNRLGR